VGRYTPRRGRGDARGFSAIELVVVLAALAVVSTVYMALQRPSEIYPVENAAQRLAGEIERARDQAVAQEGEALVAVQPDGRYAARTGAPGTLTLASTPADEWERLPEGIVWGAGDAARDPFDRPVAPLPAQVYCDADGVCGAPAPAAVYLVRSVREPQRVAAVTLDASGSVQAWRWEMGSGRWTAVAR
jgi:prepilin-type N-terminal cleavage/methylation domain-containing protein